MHVIMRTVIWGKVSHGQLEQSECLQQLVQALLGSQHMEMLLDCIVLSCCS